MSTSISSSSNILLQEVLGFYSRRMLLHSPLHHSPDQLTAIPPISGINDHDPSSQANLGDDSFDAKVIMVLSFLICAVICSLGLNLIIKCAFRCSTVFSSEPVTHNNTSPAVTLASTGIKKEALRTFPTFKYADDLNSPGLGTECVICLSQFAAGEKVRVLPKCNHGFHLWCINRWLKSHSSCPTCRHCLIQTCRKIVSGGCSQQETLLEPPPQGPQQEQVIVSIEPLQPEDVALSYQT